MDKEKLKAKLEAVKQLKTQYYIGSKSALHLVKETEGSLNLEHKLKEDISKEGIKSKFGPSYLELEEIKECIKDITSSINGTIEATYKMFMGKFLSSKNRIEYNEQITEPAKDLFLRNFALNRAKLAEQNEKSPKEKAFILTLEDYLPGIFSQYADFFKRKNIPEEVLKKAVKISKEKISRDTNVFLSTRFFEGKAEADRLEHINMRGGKYSDVLFDRLENEQVIHRDEMQRTYLARFIGEKNIKDYNDFLDTVRFSIESGDDNEKERKEKEYLKLISNRHKNWIKRFLEN